MATRNSYIDCLKGATIILVVIGHTIQCLFGDWKYSIVERAIYMFHMPLFISISGFLFHPSVEKYSFLKYVKRNLLRLYLPSLVWGMVSVVMIGASKIAGSRPIELSYFASLLFTGMWYLTVLCILNIIGSLFYHISKYNSLWLWLTLFCVVYFIPSFGVINYIKFLMPFWILGFCCKYYGINRIPLLLVLLCFLTFLYLLFATYTFKYSVYEMKNNIFSYEYCQMTIVRLIAGFSGIIMFLTICYYLMRFKKIKHFLVNIGMVTLPIYVLHQKMLIPAQLLDFSTSNTFIWILISIIVLIITLIVNNWITSKFLRFLLFGEFVKKDC